MNYIGLDIGTSSIKAVELEDKKPRELLVVADVPLPPSVSMASDSEEDLKVIANTLDKFVSGSGFTTRYVVIALPEYKVFTRVVSMPVMTEKELSTAIDWEAGQYIPVPVDEVYLSHQILGGSGAVKEKEAGSMSVLLIATPKTVVDKYLRTMKYAGLEAVAVETETTAVVRSLVPSSAKGTPGVQSAPTLIINIGAETTDLSIVSGGFIRFTRSVSTGGIAMVRAISQSLGFESPQAEEYKKTYGLDANYLDGKVLAAIKPVFDIIVGEIQRSITFYSSHYQDSELKRVIICGGTANLPGIIVYLAAALGLEVQLGNPWQSITTSESFDQQELESIGPVFAVAAGLALKEVV